MPPSRSPGAYRHGIPRGPVPSRAAPCPSVQSTPLPPVQCTPLGSVPGCPLHTVGGDPGTYPVLTRAPSYRATPWLRSGHLRAIASRAKRSPFGSPQWTDARAPPGPPATGEPFHPVQGYPVEPRPGLTRRYLSRFLGRPSLTVPHLTTFTGSLVTPVPAFPMAPSPVLTLWPSSRDAPWPAVAGYSVPPSRNIGPWLTFPVSPWLPSRDHTRWPPLYTRPM